ncbi:MAG: hypothetical protein HUU15_12910, partial [Candidatus Brocadiae bacterium]|nr:hypothetical protein [Candidatus Brocadiia bacterium]
YRGRNSTDAGGIGEPATIPTAAAVANAVYNASGVRMRALGPSSVLQIPGCGPSAFARLGQIAGKLPAFALEVGPDLGAVAAAVREAIVAGRSS